MRVKIIKKIRSFKPLTLVILAVAIILAVSVISLRTWYNQNLRPISGSTSSQYFSVERGSTVHGIGVKLKSEGLIRNSGVFEYYVRTNDLFGDLQAGTYSLSPSMSVQEIVKKIVKGDVAKNLLTILPGKRLDQIKKAFTDNGYSSATVDEAFNPGNYRDHPVLKHLPAGSSLEGYLYPDSFQKEADTPVEVIVRQSLDEMQKYLTEKVIVGFAKQGLSAHQGITLASIVLQETDDPKYQSEVARVLINRLKKDMPLEADPTAFYASETAGMGRRLDIDSPYNTRLRKGLPPGPIGSATKFALAATAFPPDNDYLFFVAGDDNKIYFSKTLAEHEELTAQHCKKKCSY